MATIEPETATQVLREALSRGAGWAELFCEESTALTINYEEGRVDRAVAGRDRGAGIRVVCDDRSAFAVSDDLDVASLLAVARAAAAACAAGASGSLAVIRERVRLPAFQVKEPPETWAPPQKVALLERADRAARGHDPHVTQCAGSYREQVRRLKLFNSDGRWVEDERVYVRLTVNVVAAKDGVVQTGLRTMGMIAGMELFDGSSPEAAGREAAAQAVVNLFAAPAPSGPMPVVMCPGWGGVLFHEASGHALEGDTVVRGYSVFAGRVGEVVASPLVTAIDDPTQPGAWGSYYADDEGEPARPTVLIERGVLVGYLWDRRNAARYGVKSTSHGRRQSYQYPPIPRMANTFIAAGDVDPASIIAATGRGFYARDLRGGQVNPVTGDFVFTVSEGYLIRNGKADEPVRGATLIGNGPEILKRIDMVGDDLSLAPGLCGKGGQSVPTTVGQPTLRISEITVGGTAAAGGG